MHIPPVNPTATAQGSPSEDPKLVQLIDEVWMAIQFLQGSSSTGNPPSAFLATICINALNALHTYLKSLPAGSLTPLDKELLAGLNLLNPEKWSVKQIQDSYAAGFDPFGSIYEVLNQYGSVYDDQGNAAIKQELIMLLSDMQSYEQTGNSTVLQRVGEDILALEGLLHPKAPAPAITDGYLLLLDALLTTPLVAGDATSTLLQLATAKNWTALAADMKAVFGSGPAMSLSEMLEAIIKYEYKNS